MPSLDHAARRQVIEARRRQGVGHQPHIQRHPPAFHAGLLARHQGLAAQEIGGGIRLQRQPLRTRQRQRRGNVRRLEEAVRNAHGEKALAQLVHRHPLGLGHEGRVGDADIAEHHALMQHLVVLQAVQQGIGHRVQPRRQEHRGAGDALAELVGPRQEQVQAQRVVAHRIHMHAPAHPPGVHHHEGGARHRQRQPAALHDLEGVGGHEGDIDQAQHAEHGQHGGSAPVPAIARHHRHQRGRDHHHAGDRDAIGRGQGVGAFEDQHDQHHAHRQHGVGARHIDLAHLRSLVWRISMRGNWPSCTAWRVMEKTPEITACEAMMVAMVASATMG